MIRPGAASLLLLLTAATAAEHAGPPSPKALPAAASDPVAALPILPAQRPQAAPAPGGDALTPGIRRIRGQAVLLDGTLNLDQGPVDGLEVLLCLRDGKTHEALVRLDTTLGAVVKAACIDGLGLAADGQPAEEAAGFPARGTPVRVELRWQDAAGAWLGLDASCLVRDRVTDRAYPPLPFVYTGSRFLALPGSGADGTPGVQQQFMLDSTKSVAVIFDEPDALLASPFPGAADDARFETMSAHCPPAGTRVVVVLSACTLPVTLDAGADGALRAGDGPVLDDGALAGLLLRHYGAGSTPSVRALAVRVPATAPRSLDVALRARLLALAARAPAWVVPVFVMR